jgi:DNA (cytosine-5)-methyltransferase 1
VTGGREVTLRFGSVCSGIEAASVAFGPLGFEAAWLAEVDPFCCALLEHYYPKVQNFGDITKITEDQLRANGPVDLVCGGTPCQSFSVAGLRKGMDDPRGNLALRFLQLVGVCRPRWVLWENVPGVASSWTGPEPPSDLEQGREWGSTETSDFGCFLDALGKLGYGWAYRTLDAQYFGVPQRRRRVFVVGCLGDWRRAAAVLFERDCLRGNSAPSREAGESVAHSLARGSCGSHGRYDPNGEDFVTAPLTQNPYADNASRETLLVPIPFDTTQVTSKDNYSQPKAGDPCHPLAKGQHPPAIAFSCKDHGQDVGDVSPTLRGMQHRDSTPNAGGQVAIAYRTSGNCGVMEQGDRTAALNCGTDPNQNIIAYQQHGSDVGQIGSLRSGRGDVQSGVPFVLQALQPDGIMHLTKEVPYGPQEKADAAETLCLLRNCVGEEALSEWGLGVLAALRSQKILQPRVHGKSIRRKAEQDGEVVNDPLPRSKTPAHWTLRDLWQVVCEGRPPSRWRPPKQLAGKLAACLSRLPHETASAAWLLCGLRAASEGLGVLRQALSEVQEVGRSAAGERESVCGGTERLRADSATRMQGERMHQSASCPRILWDALDAKATCEKEVAKEETRKETSGVTMAVRRLTPV